MTGPTFRNLLVAVAAAAVLAMVCDAAEAQKRRRPGQRRRSERSPDRLKQGDAAPDFELKTLDGKATVKLSSFRGQKPVALIFGSYT